MITVAILINGQPLMARSASRQEELKTSNSFHKYLCDDGSTINHKYSDGAVVLAKKLLDTIVTEEGI